MRTTDSHKKSVEIEDERQLEFTEYLGERDTDKQLEFEFN